MKSKETCDGGGQVNPGMKLYIMDYFCPLIETDVQISLLLQYKTIILSHYLFTQAHAMTLGIIY